MSTEKLGSCPACETPIPEGRLLIRYEDGVFAECPSCEVPVRPRNDDG